MSRLIYDKPAKIWEEALPLGNGRFGVMAFSDPCRDRLQFNEESVWYGGKMDRDNPDTLKYLPKIREYLLNGEISKAERLMRLAMSGRPESAHPYQTLGDAYFTFYIPGEITGYKRWLDIDDSCAFVEFCAGGTRYTRKIFASHPADCIVMSMEAEGDGTIDFELRLTREQRAYNGVSGDDGLLLMYGDLGKYGYDFALGVRGVCDGGSLEIIGENMVVSGAKKVALYFGSDCTYHCQQELADAISGKEGGARLEADEARKLLSARIDKTLFGAIKLGDAELYSQHVADYRKLYDRVEFVLDGCDEEEAVTDKRLLSSGDGKDIGLAKLYFDFGRYLLISCSRPGGLPATLQGLWNKDMLPPWDCKYTININMQMNYWLAENCNLPECHMPLFEHLKKMLPNGRETAKKMYGCRGFVAHHNTDIHGDTSVQDLWIPGSYWVMGAAWLCTHQWSHYLYTQDKEFLKEQFEIMREAATFFLDFMIEVDGYLMTCPSVSPENSYVLPNGEKGANGVGVTMDNQILRDLFSQCIKAAKVLGVDDELNDAIKDALTRLLPTQIGPDGRILEWRENYKEFEPGHRHISHLYGLHPSSQITKDGTPELADAARKTLEGRLAYGGGHTGWSRAWIINHYAKLWDGEAAYDNLCKLFENSTYPNMFDKHPPFQIDGNFGATAAIAEMLVQSNEDRVVLLPALPSAWKNGHIKGIRIVGNGEVDVYWENGRLASACIRAEAPIDTVVKYGNAIHVNLEKGEELTLTCKDFAADD